MILRRILNNDHCDLALECGHHVYVNHLRIPKFRKRCSACEEIARHQVEHPKDHNWLLRLLNQVPMDDRADTLVAWVYQLNASEMMQRNGIGALRALEFTERPSRYSLYQLVLDDVSDDDEAQPH